MDGGADLAALAAVLAQTKLCEITPAQQDIVSLQHNNTVGEALRELAAARILSAPVVVSSGLEDFENGGLPPGEAAPSLLGWLDVSDMVKAFLDHLHEKKVALPKSMLQLMALLEKEGPDYANKMLVTIVGGEDRGLLYQADAGTSVLTAIRGFFLGAGGPRPPADAADEAAAAAAARGKVVHRLAVFNALGEITHIVSQTDILRYLLRQREAAGLLGARSITELGLLSNKGPLVTLQPHTPTLLAFEQLATTGVTGAPVIASDGELIANLSISDIRCIEPAHFGILALPIAEFLALSHGTSYLGYSARSSKGAFHPFFTGPGAGTGATTRTVLGKQGSGAFGSGGASPRVPPPPHWAGAPSPRAGRAAAPPGSPRVGGGAAGPRPGSAGGSGISGGAMLPPGCRSADPDAADEEQQRRRKSEAGGGSAGSEGAGEDVSVPLITCGRDSSLFDVIKLMIDNHVHRVYVYDPDARPAVVGVVTPTDVLRTLCEMGLAGSPGGAGAGAGAGGIDALMPQPARPGGPAVAKKARLEGAVA